MSFRSASYAVVARIFKLIDSNGFTRLLFGPWTGLTSGVFTTYGPGYDIEYESPSWSNPSTTTGIAFEPDTGVPTRASTLLFARPTSDDGINAIVAVRGDTDLATDGQKVQLQAQGKLTPVTTVASTELASTDTVATQQLLAQSNSDIVAEIDLTGSTTIAEVLLSALEGSSGTDASLSVLVDAATNLGIIDLVADRLRYNGVGFGAWAPTVDQGATANIAYITNILQYFKLGPLVFVSLDITMNAVGTAAQPILIDLPVATAGIHSLFSGSMEFFDLSTNTRYVGGPEVAAGNQFGLVVTGVGNVTYFGSTPNVQIQVGDIIRAGFVYYTTG